MSHNAKTFLGVGGASHRSEALFTWARIEICQMFVLLR
jgi:hypothetical protein